jgi:exopolysaccharide biosynthesis polyprenyl glycosylphosphotransferase
MTSRTTANASRQRLRWVLAGADLLTIGLGAGLAGWVMAVMDTVGGAPHSELLLAGAAVPLWIGALAAAGSYRAAYLNAGSDAVRRYLVGTAGGLFSLTFLAFVIDLPISRLFVAILAGSTALLGLSARVMLRLVLIAGYRNERWTERTLIIGRDDYATDLVTLMSEGSGLPYRAVGLVWVDENGSDHPVGLDVPVIDDPSVDLVATCHSLRADVILIAPGGLDPAQMYALAVALEGHPQRIIVAPSLFRLLPWRMTVETITGLPLVHVDEVRLSGWNAVAKRTLDVVGSLTLLLLLAPVVAIAALVVLATDGRPAFFSQTRIGKDGRAFTLHKLRTMVRDAEEQLPALMDHNEAGGHFFKIHDDPRITPTGAVLRRWSIDEIPQFWSVLKGDMSLVGPRPLFSRPEEYDPIERRRLGVRPGLTGPWQVSGRSTVGGAEAVQKDLFYLENWTLFGDLVILARTAVRVLGGRGAV